MHLVDLRKINALLFNDKLLRRDYKLHDKIDRAAQQAYAKHGDRFLNAINGQFGFASEDNKTHEIFLARDWIGEVPLHYFVSGDKVLVANFISDLTKLPGYKYENVVAVNRSQVVRVNANTGSVKSHLYYRFDRERVGVSYRDLKKVAAYVRGLLGQSMRARLSSTRGSKAVLLSGGTDSMSIAYLLSRIDRSVPAYTLSTSRVESDDVARAKEIARAFGLKHKIVYASPSDVASCVRDAIGSSEIYHAYNVYCAVGMQVLAERLRRDHIKYVFTGEGGNEAFGDYRDWIVTDPTTGKKKVLQLTARDFETPQGREAYIWGNLLSESRGHYNKQLGSGLGKHGGSRMYKPMFKMGLTLVSPYLEKRLLKILANIPTDALKKIGGKPGFMKLVFAKEIKAGLIPINLFEIKKIRLQDASEGGASGITGALLKRGYTQEKIVRTYNRLFRSSVRSGKRLRRSVLVR